MIDPIAHDIITSAVGACGSNVDDETIADAIIGALATAGFAIVAVDAQVLNRVVAEMHKDS